MEVLTLDDQVVIESGDLTFIHKENMSIEEWLDTRRDGVGGSDIGVIMGVNPYSCPTRLFFEKLDLTEPKDLTDNDSVHWGRLDEPIILDQSQYWDVSDDLGYMRNYWNGRQKQFSHVDFPFFSINKRFPWLRMNVDGLGYYDTEITMQMVIDKLLNDQELIVPDKIIEIKTIKERATERWRGGIPYGYIYQVLGYLTVFLHTNEDLYGEIYSRISGTKMTRHMVDWDQVQIEEMLEETYHFWTLVEEGLRIKNAGLKEEEMMAALWNVAPEADGSKDYQDFLSETELEKLEAEANKFHGSDELLEIAYRYKKATKEASVIEADKQRWGNKLREAMVRNQSTIIDFGAHGRVKQSKRRMYVNVK